MIMPMALRTFEKTHVERSLFLTFEGPGPRVLGYRLLWVKAVVGFDANNHCARCLRGPILKSARELAAANVRKEFVMPKNARAIYICGVSSKGYHFNLHAPCVPDEAAGPTIIPMTNGQRLIIENAALLPINPLPLGFAGRGPEFTTCRNWQFGVQTFGLGCTRSPSRP